LLEEPSLTMQCEVGTSILSSIAKSVLELFVGIALDRGLFKSVDATCGLLAHAWAAR
jgi:hypothetical protein